MKLQFAFGNPRKKSKKAKKARKKRVAISKKKAKNKRKTKTRRHKGTGAKHMSKKRKKAKKPRSTAKRGNTLKRRKGGKKRKNPTMTVRDASGKLLHKGQRYKTDAQLTAIEGRILAAKLKARTLREQLRRAKASGTDKEVEKFDNLLHKIEAMKSDMESEKEKVLSERKVAEYHLASGHTIREHADKRKKKKKPKKAKKAKKAKSKKAKKRKSKKSKKAKSRKSKKAKSKKTSKRRSKKRGRRTKPHRHALSTRHVAKGSRAKFASRKKNGSFKIKTKIGKGKRKIKVSGRARITKSGTLKGFLKFNPFRSNPMSQIMNAIKKPTDIKTAELIGLAIGGALIPVINKYVTPTVSSYLPSIPVVGAKLMPYTGILVPALLGAAANVAADMFVKDAKTRDQIRSVGDALIAAGIVGGSMTLTQQVSGMSGVVYTPMSGVNFTPSMHGVNYTPDRPMGITPQLSGPDFGRTADYGGNAGYVQGHRFSRADFGHTMDEDSDEIASEDDITDENLSGSMG